MTTEAQTQTALPPGELAALAAGVLLIGDAQLYGLIDSGLDIDRQHCEAILDRLAHDGITPDEDQALDAAIALMVHLGVVRA